MSHALRCIRWEFFKDGTVSWEFYFFCSIFFLLRGRDDFPRNDMVSRLLGSRGGEMESGALSESGNPLDSEVLVLLLASGSVSG